MAVASVLFNNFSAGELSPLMAARSDFARYATGAKNLENWLVLLQGGLRTRFGTRLIVKAKYGNRLCRLLSFEATDEEVYVVEMGHLYMRFCTPSGQVAVSGTPVEIAIPYQDTQLRAVRTAQANDVMILVHKEYPPGQLSRLSPTLWSYKPIMFDPPPLYEAGYFPVATLTPNALTGSITLTANAGVFLESDIDRVVQAGDARVAITGYTSATVVTGDVLSAFTSLATINSGDWKLERSPVAELQPSRKQPVGSQVRLDLRVIQAGAPDLVVNGTFAQPLSVGWTDSSGPVLTTGTHTGVVNTMVLVDSTKNWYTVGVQPGHLVVNVTDGSRGSVLRIEGTNALVLTDLGTAGVVLKGGTDNDFDTGDAYSIQGSGGAEVRNGKAYLTGNILGTGWIQEGVPTVVDRAYRVTFDVAEGSISAQVGSTLNDSDLKEELGYDQGNDHEMIFVATTTTSYLQFRNNQPTAGAVDNVECRLYSGAGWRVSDIGKYVQVNDGLIKITSTPNPTRAVGTIVRELTTKEAAPGGAWKLLEPAWSPTLGYPSVVSFFEGRLYLSGALAFPQKVWMSKVDDFYNFFLGPNASDAMELQIVDSSGNITLNQVRWLAPGENLLIGTTHAEYRATGATEGAFSAVDLPLVRLQSTFGSDTIQPIRVGQALLFSQRQGSKIRQMSFEADVAASFLAKDITNLSGHFLQRHRAVEFAYQPEALPLVYVIRSDGQLLTLTYDLSEEVVGWSHLVTQGEFESIAPVPHPTAQSYQAWMSVQRVINGTTVRCIEVFDDQAEMRGRVAIDGVVPSWYGLTLDSALLYDFGDTPTALLTGLTHLIGAQVQVVADGAVFPLQTVTAAGTVTLSVPAYRAWVGLPFTCTAETLPLETMLRTGTTHGHERNWLRLVAQLYETIGLKVNGQQMPFRTPGMPLSHGVALYTGKYPLIAPSEWSMESTLVLKQDQSLPATVLAIAGELDFGGSG